MAYFSRFDGDNNEDLYLLQRSVWFGRGFDSAMVQFFSPSIEHYRECTRSINLIDPITIVLNRGCVFENHLFLPFMEIISAYYRFVFGYQLQIPFPGFETPQTKEDWISHYRKFLCMEGEKFVTIRDFFPDIIHLLVIQNLPYAIELQKHLLLITSRICSNKIMEMYDREISFLSDKEHKMLQQHENDFEILFRNEIVKLIEAQKEDFLEFYS